MIAITLLFFLSVAAVLAIAANQWTIPRSFALLSILPTMLCLGSFLGLLHNSNSFFFYASLVCGLLSSVLLSALGIGFIIFRLRSRASVRKEDLLTLVAGAPMIYAVLKRWF
jgi:hypothetical protein